MTPERFERLMTPFAPFEARPHLAVALSGGGDSMALLVLARDWAAARGGRVTALTVDHGLREASTDEARQVGRWAAAPGVDHAVIPWTGAKPESGIQDAARQARYRLLDDACRARGILHLLVAHTRDDQAETVLLRLGRGSGPDGLAAMAATRELGHCRILRPLLGTAREELRDLLRAAGTPWVEDPSNLDERFARPRLRQRLAADAGLDPAALAESARRYGLVRVVLERDTEALLAGACRLHDAGFATLDPVLLAQAPEDLALRALGRVLAAVGGLGYPPRRRRVEQLLDALRDPGGASATLGRCRVVARGGEIGIFREARNAPDAEVHAPGTSLVWDRRFRVQFGARPSSAGRDLRLVAFRPGQGDAALFGECMRALPAEARWGLPALADEHGLFAVPHLQYRRDGGEPDTGFRRLRFDPVLAVSAGGFGIVSGSPVSLA